MAIGLWHCAAQESLRESLAGAEAARARREAARAIDYYNVKLGPTAWTFGAGLSLEANDNIVLESAGEKADLILHPEVDTRMVWPVSELNSLNLALGAGYSAYVVHPAYSRFYVQPGSEVSFDMYAGDFWVNLHDRLSITENSYQDPTVVGSADYSQLQNAVGVATTWDLNQGVAKVGYDHVNYVSLQGTPATTGRPDGVSEVFYSSAGLTLRPGTLLGVEAGGELFHYDQTSTNQTFTDATAWNVGPFCESQLTEYVRGRVSAGYTVYTPTGNAASSADVFSGLYAEAELAHRLNRFVDYTLAGGRNISFAFFGGTVDLIYVRWQGNWHILQKMALGTSFEYEHGSQLATPGASEVFDRYGPGLSLGWPLTTKLSSSVGYQFYLRSSNFAGRDYTVNVATVSVRCRF